MRRMVYGWGPSVTLIRLCILMLRTAPHDIYDTEGYVEEDRYSIDTTLDSLILKGSDTHFCANEVTYIKPVFIYSGFMKGARSRIRIAELIHENSLRVCHSIATK